MQGDGGGWVVGLDLAGALLQLRLHLPDRVIQVINQEIEECCQTVGLHLSDDLECCFAPVEFSNNFHIGHMPLLPLGGRIHTLPCMAMDLVTRIYRQLVGKTMSPYDSVLIREEL
jgi:hypothetical protein